MGLGVTDSIIIPMIPLTKNEKRKRGNTNGITSVSKCSSPSHEPILSMTISVGETSDDNDDNTCTSSLNETLHNKQSNYSVATFENTGRGTQQGGFGIVQGIPNRKYGLTGRKSVDKQRTTRNSNTGGFGIIHDHALRRYFGKNSTQPSSLSSQSGQVTNTERSTRSKVKEASCHDCTSLSGVESTIRESSMNTSNSDIQDVPSHLVTPVSYRSEQSTKVLSTNLLDAYTPYQTPLLSPRLLGEDQTDLSYSTPLVNYYNRKKDRMMRRRASMESGCIDATSQRPIRKTTRRSSLDNYSKSSNHRQRSLENNSTQISFPPREINLIQTRRSSIGSCSATITSASETSTSLYKRKKSTEIDSIRNHPSVSKKLSYDEEEPCSLDSPLNRSKTMVHDDTVTDIPLNRRKSPKKASSRKLVYEGHVGSTDPKQKVWDDALGDVHMYHSPPQVSKTIQPHPTDLTASDCTDSDSSVFRRSKFATSRETMSNLRTPSPKKTNTLNQNSFHSRQGSVNSKRTSVSSVLSPCPSVEPRMPVRQASLHDPTTETSLQRAPSDLMEVNWIAQTPKRRESISPIKTPQSVKSHLSKYSQKMNEMKLSLHSSSSHGRATTKSPDKASFISPFPTGSILDSATKQSTVNKEKQTPIRISVDNLLSPGNNSDDENEDRFQEIRQHSPENFTSPTKTKPVKRYGSGSTTPFSGRRQPLSLSSSLSNVAIRGAVPTLSLNTPSSSNGHSSPNKSVVKKAFQTWSKKQRSQQGDGLSDDNGFESTDESIQALLLMRNKSSSSSNSSFRMNSNTSFQQLPFPSSPPSRNSSFLASRQASDTDATRIASVVSTPTLSPSRSITSETTMGSWRRDAWLNKQGNTTKKAVSFPSSLRLSSLYYEPVLLPVQGDENENNIVLKSDLYWTKTEIQVIQRVANRNAQKFSANNQKFVRKFEKWLSKEGERTKTIPSRGSSASSYRKHDSSVMLSLGEDKVQDLLRSTSSLSISSSSSIDSNDDEIVQKWVDNPRNVRGLEQLVASGYYRPEQRRDIISNVVSFHEQLRRKNNKQSKNDKKRGGNPVVSPSKLSGWNNQADEELLRQHCRRQTHRSCIIAQRLAFEDSVAAGTSESN